MRENKLIKLLIIGLFLIVLSSIAYGAAGSTTYYLDDDTSNNATHGEGDTYVEADDPSANNYLDNTFIVNQAGSSLAMFAYLRFNLSDVGLPANSNITNCDLRLEKYIGDVGEVHKLYYINDSEELYNFKTLNYTNAPCLDGNDINTTLCPMVDDGASYLHGEHIFDKANITPYCNNSLQDSSVIGFIVSSTSTTQATTYYSSNYYLSGYHPRLYLNYVSPDFTDLFINVTHVDNSSQLINNFSIVLVYGATNYSNTSTSGNITYPDLVRNSVVDIYITADGYQATNITDLTLDVALKNVTFNLTPIGRMNISFYDEILNTQMTNEEIDFNIIGDSNINYTTTTGYQYIANLSSGTYEFRYKGNTTYWNSYFLTITETTSSDLRLYLINTSESNLIDAHVEDSGNNIEDAYLIVYKRFIPENTYRIVRMAATDFAGDAGLYLNKYDTWYRFAIQYPLGTTTFISSNDYQITKDELNFNINVGGDILESYRIIDDVYILLDYNNLTNTTGRISYQWIDSNSIVQEGCLEIIQRGALSDTTLSNTCANGTSGELYYDINETGAYYAIAYLESNTNNSLYVVDNLALDFDARFDTFGNFGIFLAFIIILVLVLFGAYHPQISLVMLGFGIIITYFLGFFYMSLTTLAGFIILILITLFVQRER